MNYKDALSLASRYLKARIPFISIKTVEKNRAITMLLEVAKESNEEMYLHSMSKGFINLKSRELVNSEKLLMGALDFISEQLKTKQNMVFILSDVNEIDKDTLTSRYFADIVNLAESKNSSIFVITSSPIWVHLQRLGMNIDLNLPNDKEILTIIKGLVNKYIDQIEIEWDESDFKEAASTLEGISKIEVKNVISSLLAKGEITKQDLVDLKFAKDSLFSNINGLEKIEVEDNLSYGGLDNLKEWLDEKKKLMRPEVKELLLKKGIKPPRGVLLLGVSGCGKSLSAKEIAKRFSLPLYRLDFATIQGKYVGQSEQQLKEAFETTEHVSPCVLWIDEIEKGLSGGNDSSGVTQRLIGQFLFWLQECKKDVFVVATANNVDELPPELLRKGRFDEMFFIDLPNKIERKEIINLYLTKYLAIKVNDDYLSSLADVTENFSGADIEAKIRELSYKIVINNENLNAAAITNALKNAVSSYKTNKEKVDKIRDWAKDRTVPASKLVSELEKETTVEETPVEESKEETPPTEEIKKKETPEGPNENIIEEKTEDIPEEAAPLDTPVVEESSEEEVMPNLLEPNDSAKEEQLNASEGNTSLETNELSNGYPDPTFTSFDAPREEVPAQETDQPNQVLTPEDQTQIVDNQVQEQVNKPSNLSDISSSFNTPVDMNSDFSDSNISA